MGLRGDLLAVLVRGGRHHRGLQVPGRASDGAPGGGSSVPFAKGTMLGTFEPQVMGIFFLDCLGWIQAGFPSGSGFLCLSWIFPSGHPLFSFKL